MSIDAQGLKNILAKNLSSLLSRKAMTQTDLARELSLPEMTVSNWVTGKTYPRMDKVQLLADYFGVLKSDLTEEKQEIDIKQIDNVYHVNPEAIKYYPVLGGIACGEPILAEENITEYRAVHTSGLPSGDLFFLKAVGDSMEPRIPDGSYVLIRPQPSVENGEIAALLLNGDSEATLKRVRKLNDKILLEPINEAYEPYLVDEDNPARILGKAIKVEFGL